jgi:sedoheptulokinase
LSCFYTVHVQVAANPSPIHYWPYFNNNYLALVASMNGGNVLARWISMFCQVFRLVGRDCPEEDLWSHLLKAASTDGAMNTSVVATPLLYGERHLPEARGRIEQIGPDGFVT